MALNTIEYEVFNPTTGTWSSPAPSSVSPIPAWTGSDFKFITVPGLTVGTRYRFRAPSVDFGPGTSGSATNDTLNEVATRQYDRPASLSFIEMV